MIKIDQHSPQLTLTISCDFCGNKIDDPEMALYTWREVHVNPNLGEQKILLETMPPTILPDDGKIFFVHKGVCDRYIKELNGGENNIIAWPCYEMIHLPGHMLRALNLSIENPREGI